MNYKWPIIRTLDDVLPAIKDRQEFIIAERGDYNVVNYLVNLQDTFPSPDTKDPELNRLYTIRRECRGIIFCAKTGKVISRPFSKFFNIGEKPETATDKIDFSQDHVVLHKLDGSFIRPFRTYDGKLRIGTKMGETEVAAQAGEFFFARPEYVNAGNWACDNNITLIFEWTSLKNRIVVKYDQDNLVLLAARHNVTGEYLDY